METDWGDESTGQRTPKITRKLPETRGEAWAVSPSVPGRRQPADTLTLSSDSGLRAVITVVLCKHPVRSARSWPDPATHPHAGLAAPGGARAATEAGGTHTCSPVRVVSTWRACTTSVGTPWALLAGLPLHLQSGFLWAPRPLHPGSGDNATLRPLWGGPNSPLGGWSERGSHDRDLRPESTGLKEDTG